VGSSSSGGKEAQYPPQIRGFDPVAGYSLYGGNITQYSPQIWSFDSVAGSSSLGGNDHQYLPQNWGFNPTAGSSSSGGNIKPTANELYFSQNPSGTIHYTLRILCNLNFNYGLEIFRTYL